MIVLDAINGCDESSNTVRVDLLQKELKFFIEDSMCKDSIIKDREMQIQRDRAQITDLNSRLMHLNDDIKVIEMLRLRMSCCECDVKMYKHQRDVWKQKFYLIDTYWKEIVRNIGINC